VPAFFWPPPDGGAGNFHPVPGLDRIGDNQDRDWKGQDMRIDASRAIGAYAAVMTLATLWLGLSAVSAPPASFTTIDVQRINVREPDGTLRLAISNHALIPGIIVGKKEYPHPNRPEAGMIFFNDEGIENGGLVFDGGMKNGRPTNGGSFTFDRYMQDQTLQLISTEDGKDRRVGVLMVVARNTLGLGDPLVFDSSRFQHRAGFHLPNIGALDFLPRRLARGINEAARGLERCRR
jgi:hypothetical protein